MIGITCLQEHRIIHPDENVKHQSLGNNWTLVTSSAVKNSINATIGRVGLLLDRNTYNSLLKTESITD